MYLLINIYNHNKYYKMGTSLSTISHRIRVEYIDTVKCLLNHNNPNYPLIVNVDKITEFLNEETQWSTSGSVNIDEIYWNFTQWLKRRYKINKYDKKIFIEKLSKQRKIVDGAVCHMKMVNMSNSEIMRL